ncbi:MAG: hypothetical protein ACREKH_02955, partial [Candidatus Rokuibacteriota bacterium]
MEPRRRERIFAAGERFPSADLVARDVAALSTTGPRACGAAVRALVEGDVRARQTGTVPPTLVTATAADPVTAAGRIVSLPGTVTCAVYLTASPRERRGLILGFGHHLAILRGSGPPGTRAVLVADTGDVPAGEPVVAIPH